MSTTVVIILVILLLAAISFLFNSWFAFILIFFIKTLSPEKEVQEPTWKEITPVAFLLMAEGFFSKIIKIANPLLQTILETIILVLFSYFFVKCIRKIIPSQKENANASVNKRRRMITMIIGLVVFFTISYMINTH